MTSLISSLPDALTRALADKGYETLTPVQEAVLAPELAGRDLLVSAQTGSGKTVAFGLAIAGELLGDAAMLPPPDSPRALIIAPTRELALQVGREFQWLYGAAGVVLASCVGGMDARTERRALERGAHVVVGTPGRLRDHIERGNIDLSAIKVVTLDEADEMLDLGFREDLEFILEALPEERRTLLFSATVPRDIERLARTYQRDAQRVATQAARDTHADIAYRALTVAPEDAENAIVNLLRYYEARNALVFCKTRMAVNHLTARLLNRGFAVVPLSGELAQDERARALQAMRDGRARVCVATDVAARGIDLPGLELVIHADLPSNKETLLHRSGRTGRAGNKGVSALIVPMNARRRAERLLSSANLTAEWGPAPTAADVSARDTERLLTDEALTRPEQPDEMDLITHLVERFTPRELAAAVMRFYFSARSAPEDVVPVSPDGPKPRPRADFERSFWMRLNVGRDRQAEPRWLLPMLCRVGNLTKADIGAIRIFDDHTLVQLHDDCRERFLAALGPEMTLEQGVTVSPTSAPAEGDRPAPRGKDRGGARKSAPRGDRHDRSDRPERPERKPDGARPPRPERARQAGNGAEASTRPAPSADRKLRSGPKTDKPASTKSAPAKTATAKPAPAGTAAPRGKPAGFDPSNPSARLDGARARKPRAKFAAKTGGKHGARPGEKPGAKSGGDRRPTRPKR